MSKEIFIGLRSALYPPENVKISVNRGEERIDQVYSGINIFLSHLNSISNKEKYEIFFIDNTIESEEDIPEKIIKVIKENNIIPLVCNKNYYGSKNKGAGDIDLLRENFNLISDFKWLLHFEPRTVLQSPNFLDECLKSPKNLFKIFYPNEPNQHFYTGIFMIGTKEIKDFIDSVDLDKMVRDKESIEYLFKNFMDEKYSDTYQDYPDKLNIIWHDTHQDRFIEF